jgi:cytochrome c peroxidase
MVFFGQGRCVECHNGPPLAAMEFHAIGLKDLDSAPGAIIKNAAFSERLGRGAFTGHPADRFLFKVPQLYNLKDHAAFGHGSSFTSLRDFISYMNAGVAENPKVPPEALAPQFKPLGLSQGQQDDLLAFLEDGLRDPDLRRYLPSRLPSRFCMPNNDRASQQDPYSYCP